MGQLGRSAVDDVGSDLGRSEPIGAAPTNGWAWPGAHGPGVGLAAASMQNPENGEPRCGQSLTPDIGAYFASIALGHVMREYPNKLDHILACAEDARAPSALHPIFYGSFDWHSCVHGYWLLARVLRRFPAAHHTAEIVDLFDEQLTTQKVAGDCDYLAAPTARGFERPYGWCWLLKLAAELAELPEKRWSRALSPLAEMFAQRFRDFLPIAPYPVRVGTHFNTAFAIRMAADYAEAIGDEPLLALLRATGERWYGRDLDCPAWGEPSGDDFLSSTLIEAECMRRLLAPERFLPWFDRFLPHLFERLPATLFIPATATDRGDGKIAHARREALARRGAHHRHDAYRRPGEARRQGRRLDGEGQRRAIPGLIIRMAT